MRNLILLLLLYLPIGHLMAAHWEVVLDKREVHYRVTTASNGLLDLGCSLSFNVLLGGNFIVGKAELTDQFTIVIDGNDYPNFFSPQYVPSSFLQFQTRWEAFRHAKTIVIISKGIRYNVPVEGLSTAVPPASLQAPFQCRPINGQGTLLK